jgi:hypothetical protein
MSRVFPRLSGYGDRDRLTFREHSGGRDKSLRAYTLPLWMTLRFREIANRLTGFSTPLFGVQWNAPTLDVEIARKAVAFLEDRRVLYAPESMEMPEHVVRSVIEIRAMLTDVLGQVDRESHLGQGASAMRAACRKCIDRLQASGIDANRMDWGSWQEWEFSLALGELRGVVGIHVALIAAAYGIDVEEPLASILPVADSDDADA